MHDWWIWGYRKKLMRTKTGKLQKRSKSVLFLEWLQFLIATINRSKSMQSFEVCRLQLAQKAQVEATRPISADWTPSMRKIDEAGQQKNEWEQKPGNFKVDQNQCIFWIDCNFCLPQLIDKNQCSRSNVCRLQLAQKAQVEATRTISAD